MKNQNIHISSKEKCVFQDCRNMKMINVYVNGERISD
jgi:hypothetical protein